MRAKLADLLSKHLQRHLERQSIKTELFTRFPRDSPPSLADADAFLEQHHVAQCFPSGSTLIKFHKNAYFIPSSSRQAFAIQNDNAETAFAEHCTTQDWPGLLIVSRGKRGRAVVSTKRFNKGDLVCNYNADILRERERISGDDTTYVMDVYNPGKYVLDTWEEEKHKGEPGRLINHSSRHPNLQRYIKNKVCGREFIVFFTAVGVITPGEELLIDYQYETREEPEWYRCCPCVKCLPLGDTFLERPPLTASTLSSSESVVHTVGSAASTTPSR